MATHYRHLTCFSQRKHSTFHSSVIAIVEITQHFPVLFPSIHLEEPAGRYEAFPPILDQTEERTKRESLVEVQQNMVHWDTEPVDPGDNTDVNTPSSVSPLSTAFNSANLSSFIVNKSGT